MVKRIPVDIHKVRPSEGSQVDAVLGSASTVDAPSRATRVVAIPLSEILPDRFQARVILPPEIRHSFFAGEIDCFSAAHSLMIAAAGDDGLRLQVDDLLRLGESILKDTQIEPATGAWVQTSAGLRFLLESGERRFWALCLIAEHLRIPENERPRLQVIELKINSRVRQAAENLQREDLSAVDLAKAAAALILVLLEIYPDPKIENEFDYYRQVFQFDRLPSGTWPTIERITGYSQPYLSRHLQILGLDDELLYLASLHRLEERRLREIVTAEPDEQRGLVLRAIGERLTSGDIERAVERSRADKPNREKQTKTALHPGVHRQAARRVRSLFKLLWSDEFDRSYDQVARELSATTKNPRDLERMAKNLEALATSVRKIRSQLT